MGVVRALKKYYILFLIIVLLGSIAIYNTYAMFTASVETDNIVNMDTDVVYKFKINGTQQLKVTKGSKLRFNAVVENDMTGKISYGVYYKMISPTTIPSGVIIAQVSDNLVFTAKGQLESGASTTVPLVIKNPSNTDITIEIGVRTGYATSSQGVDDIIYNQGEIPITSFQTNEEAGNYTCNATINCTTQCIKQAENGMNRELCYCYTGNDTEITTRTSDEMLKYLGLTAKTGTPNFANIATSDEGIYSANDDYGKSYYFRGASTKNYVKFANKWWRIIRINGDGTIRMIYDGTTAHNNGESSSDRYTTNSAFNSNRNYNAYVGYMYGKAGSSNYAAEHANTNNSTIKGVVDSWYKTNIKDAGFGDKIADVIYCNDRSIDTTQGGSGTGSNVTDYGADYRLYDNKSPILTCSQQNDRFTVDDTTKGNGALTYPVGLITADEVSMAGGKNGSNNTGYYLYIGNYYWTMSPSFF